MTRQATVSGAAVAGAAALCAALMLCAGTARADLFPLDGAAAQDRACVATPEPAPHATTLAGCSRAWCAGTARDALCLCERAGAAEDGKPHHEYLQADAPARRWPAEVSPMFGAEAFSVSRADLDGDGLPERVVEQRQAVSNGMAVAYATLCVWPSSAPTPHAVCREVEDWGYLTRLVREGGRQACSLIDAGWLPGREPRRGEGTYAVGRTLRLDARGWQPVAARPLMARRLLRSFERERGQATQQAEGTTGSRLWYQSPETRRVRCPDPLCEHKER